MTPDDWQYLVLEEWLGETSRGKWAAGRCGLSVPRQNGKNAIIEMVELYFMVALGLKILHTAHEVKTARKAFIRLLGFFTNERKWPELHALLKERRLTNGQEAIILHTPDCPAVNGGDCACSGGGSCEFVARSRGSARGFTADVLVCDEAQELTDEQLEALLPTISAAPAGDPQQFYIGTPPPPGSPGTVFRRMRDDAIKRRSRRLAWLEWSVETPGDISDPVRWAEANPALGIRVKRSVIEDELRQMSPDGFARERLGWWEDTGGVVPRAITDGKWAAVAGTAPDKGVPSYGVKFSVDGETVSLGVGVKTPNGTGHVELVKHLPASQSGELVAWLTEGDDPRASKCAQIVIDGRAGAGAFQEALLAEKVPKSVLWRPTADQYTTAHKLLSDAIETGELTQFAPPGEPLDMAVAHATKRTIGSLGGWGWGSNSPDVDVTPLDAVTLAYWAAMTSKRKPGRKVRAVVL